MSNLTFDNHDKLNLKPFSQKVESFLMVEHEFVEGSLVVSLNAPFGAGKTTFLTMWKDDLEKRRASDSKVPTAIIINAWESDYCGDPLLSIVSALLKVAGNETPEKNDAAGKLRDAAKDVGWFVTGLANNLVSHWTGLDPSAAGKLAEEKKHDRQPKIPDFVSLYDERTKALGKLKEALHEVLGGETPKAFVFVDELDRCRPDYAISYLETIKHVFDVHGLAFVLAVDYEQIESSAKALFGENLKFHDYFRKFVQRRIALPEPDAAHLEKLSYFYVKRYLEREGKRVSLMDLNQSIVKNITDLISALRMPPRQIQETFRIIGHTVAGEEAKKGRLFWAIGTGVILMASLKVANVGIFSRIGKGEASHEEVGKYLVSLLGPKKSEWWFFVYLSGCGSRLNLDASGLQKLFVSLRYIEADSKVDVARRVGEFSDGWGHNWNDRWTEIYEKIETANSF
jgi:hypothetical protein